MLITLSKMFHVHSKWRIILKSVLNVCEAVYVLVPTTYILVEKLEICFFLVHIFNKIPEINRNDGLVNKHHSHNS